MEHCNNDLLLKAINRKDTQRIKLYLEGTAINKICSGGITPLIAAVQTGNLDIVKLLAENTKITDSENNVQRPNIGFFVVRSDSMELGDGPTPEGMEDLEWDMEVKESDSDLKDDDISSPSSEDNLYKWYARILSKTSIILQSQEHDMARLDGHGLNVLHYAIKQSNLDIVQYLLENYQEITVNQCDSCTNSPLHLAVSYSNNLDLIKYLLSKGADVNAFSRSKQTPLHLASAVGNVKIVNLLLENHAQVDVYDLEDQSPLMKAAIHSHNDVARILIKRSSKLNHEDIYGATVLYHAVSGNLTRVVKDLLAVGAKVVQSQHLLHIAIRNGNVEILKSLHRSGAILTVRDDQGNTPLMSACLAQNYEIAEYLLGNGAPVNAVNHLNGMTALHTCVQSIREENPFREFLELFLRYDVNINATSHYGNVLFYSIILENITAACILVKYGVDINRRDEYAFFDNLCLSKKHGNFELVKMIIYAGFNFRNMMFDLGTLRNFTGDRIFEFIAYMKSEPLNLRDLCRIKIRRCLGKRLMVKIHQLPLPTYMQKYLALDIL